MLYHFVGAYIKDTLPTTIVTYPISHRDASLIELLPPNTYAYFIFDSYTPLENIQPFNFSPITFFGGRVYSKLELDTEAKARGKNLRITLVAPPWMSPEKAHSAKALIYTANKIWMPFFEKDILINVHAKK